VASILALGPDLAARAVLETQPGLLHVVGLFALLVLTITSAVANAVKGGGPVRRILVFRVVGFLIAVGSLVAVLVTPLPARYALLFLGGYVAPLFIDSTLHIFRHGWARTLRPGESVARDPLTRMVQLIARFVRLLRDGFLALALGVVEDVWRIVHFLREWAAVYLFVWLAFSVLKVLYGWLSAATVDYVETGRLFVLGGVALLFLLAIFTHTIAAAALVKTPTLSAPAPGTKVYRSLGLILGKRIDDALGVWATALCCVIPLPGLIVFGVVGRPGLLWPITVGGMLVACVGLWAFGRREAFASLTRGWTRRRRREG
jgi:hypothetical protein